MGVDIDIGGGRRVDGSQRRGWSVIGGAMESEHGIRKRRICQVGDHGLDIREAEEARAGGDAGLDATSQGKVLLE